MWRKGRTPWGSRKKTWKAQFGSSKTSRIRGAFTMYCAQCGKQIKDQVKFCPYCGSPTGVGEEAQAAPAAAEPPAQIPVEPDPEVQAQTATPEAPA
ncbi:MAG: zinc ribbon domain-containing protein [Coriobacteriales bacterium]|nr:zinc ribbon domain-containing protein [Coriobacteriales bacterium]